MFDFDKWTPFQWAALFGSAIAGGLMAWVGRLGRNRQPDEDRERIEREQAAIEIVRLRDKVRDNEIKQECHLVVAQAQQAMGEALKATRESVEGEFKDLRAFVDRIDERLRKVEIGQSHPRRS